MHGTTLGVPTPPDKAVDEGEGQVHAEDCGCQKSELSIYDSIDGACSDADQVEEPLLLDGEVCGGVVHAGGDDFQPVRLSRHPTKAECRQIGDRINAQGDQNRHDVIVFQKAGDMCPHSGKIRNAHVSDYTETATYLSTSS